MTPVQFEDFEYRIAACFVCPLINGDPTGLTDDDEQQLDAFVEREIGEAIGHWSIDDADADFAHCEVTGLMAEVVTLTFHRIMQ